MTKDKLTITDLASLLASKLEISQKNAEDFVKIFFDSIEETLLSNDQVKIKNLGTFKLSWNDARKSVDVNTGDEIVIDGYNKVVFAPDASLKELVNQPFAHLEPVVISQDSSVSVASEPKIDPKTEEKSEVPLKVLNEQADEIKNILSEINSMNEVQDASGSKDVVDESPIASDLGSVMESTVDESNSAVEAKVETETIVEQSKERLTQNEKTSAVKSKSKAWLWLVSLFVIIALAYFFKDSLIPINTQPQEIVEELPAEVIVVDSAIQDSAQHVEAIPVDSLQLWFDSDRVYKEFIGSVKMTSGNRLTLISLETYGAKEFWIYIYEANKDNIPNPDIISIGQTIRLPKLPLYVIDIQNPKCVEFAKHLSDELKSKGS